MPGNEIPGEWLLACPHPEPGTTHPIHPLPSPPLWGGDGSGGVPGRVALRRKAHRPDGRCYRPAAGQAGLGWCRRNGAAWLVDRGYGPVVSARQVRIGLAKTPDGHGMGIHKSGPGSE